MTNVIYKNQGGHNFKWHRATLVPKAGVIVSAYSKEITRICGEYLHVFVQLLSLAPTVISEPTVFSINCLSYNLIINL
jgi:hypothetical protein